MSDRVGARVDHYVWKGYVIPDQWDDPVDEVLAVSKNSAMELIAAAADVENDGWVENDRAGRPLYQLRDTEHHMVGVKRVPVHRSEDD